MILPVNAWNFNNSANETAGAITSLISACDEIVLSENLNNFTFTPLLTGGGLQASTLIQVGGYITPGETITITSNLASITLTASIAPSSGEFYTEAVAIATPAYLAMVAYSIADTINQSLSFFNNYIISLVGTQITILAKQYGDNPNTVSSTTSPNILVLDIDGDPFYESESKIDYQGFVEVWVGDDIYSDVVDKYTFTLADQYTIDSGTSTVNLSVPVVGNYVNPILPNKILTPSPNYFMMDQGVTGTGTPIPTEDTFGNPQFVMRPYFLLYGDSFKYVTNGQRKKYIKGVTAIKWVQLGAFDQLLPYDMFDYVWLPFVNKTFKFLTSCPNTKGASGSVNNKEDYKTVSEDSQEFLQTIVKKSGTIQYFNVQVRWNFYDGTSIVEDKPTQTMLNVGGNISFDVSPKVLDFEAIEIANGKLIDSYEVRIKFTFAVTTYSETKVYKFDRTCYDNKKQILFLNEYGAWDSLEFRGEINEDISREILTIRRALPFDANNTSAISKEISINVNTNVTTLYTLRSGLINDLHINWIKKLAESSAVYIWDEDVLKYRNIILTDVIYFDNTVTTSDSMQITFMYGTENSISR